MKLINIDARHMLAEEDDKRFIKGAKRLGIGIGIITIILIIGSLATQYVCDVMNWHCM